MMKMNEEEEEERYVGAVRTVAQTSVGQRTAFRMIRHWFAVWSTYFTANLELLERNSENVC